MRTIYLIFLSFTWWVAQAQAPYWEWARDAYSPEREWVNDVAYDQNFQNTYIGGLFDNNLSSFYGPAFAASNGFTDGFVAKYNSVGNLLWAFKLGGIGLDEVRSVCTDATGNVYVAGNFNNTIDMDPSPGVFNLTAGGIAGQSDCFLAKYTPGGALSWAVRIGGMKTDQVRRIFVNETGVFITGLFDNSATFYSTNATTKTTFGNHQDFNFYGAKYNSAGVVQWVVCGGSAGDDQGNDVTADNNNVYFVGHYQNNFTIYNASGNSAAVLPIISSGKNSVFVAAFTQAGNFAWSNNICSSDDVEGNAIGQSAGQLFIAGSIKAPAYVKYPATTHTITPVGGIDILLAALSKTNGAFAWASSQTGSGSGDESALDLNVDCHNNLQICGYFKGVLNYSPYNGPVLSPIGNEDVFVATFNQTGNFLWAAKGGASNKDMAFAIGGDAGNVYVGGYYSSGAAFGTHTLVNAGKENIYLAKVSFSPTANNFASSSQTICAGGSVQSFTGQIPTGGIGTFTYSWVQSSDGNTWTAAPGTNTMIHYSPPTPTATIYYRRMVYSPVSCNPSASNILTIQVSPLAPPAMAGTDQTVCSSTGTLSAISPSVGSGWWSVAGGSAQIQSPGSFTSPVSQLVIGNNLFVWTITTSTACPQTSDTVAIFRMPEPSPANAGTDQTLCSASATLSASQPSIGSGSWQSLGTASIVSPNSSSTAVTQLSVGSNFFVWSVSSISICPVNKDTVKIVREALPTPAFAGADQTVCASIASLNGNTPTIGTGSWTAVGGTAQIQAPSSPTTSISQLSYGQNLFVWSIKNGSFCPVSRDTVLVQRLQEPGNANAGADQTLCSTSGSLSASQPTVGTGNWQSLGTASVVSPNSWSTSVAQLSVGTNYFVWTVSNSSICPVNKDTVRIIREALPTPAFAGADQTVCMSLASLNANTPSIGTGSWSAIGGTAQVQSPNSPATGVSQLSYNQNLFEWSIKNGTVCPVSRDTVLVQRLQEPSPANAGADLHICSPSATISATPPGIGSGSWSAVQNGVIVNPFNPVTAITAIPVGDSYFVYSTYNTTICPVNRDTVKVLRDAPPSAAAAGADEENCSSAATLVALPPLTGTGLWTAVGGGAQIAAPNSFSTFVTQLSAGSNLFEWSVTNGSVCPVERDTVVVFRYLMPDLANAGPDLHLCSSSHSVSGNVPIVGTPSWTALNNQTLNSPQSFSTIVTQLSPGLNYLIYSISNSSWCPVSYDTLIIQRDLEPSPALAGADQEICTADATLSAQNPLTGSGFWTLVNGSGQPTATLSPICPVIQLGFGNNMFAWTVTNGSVCPANKDSVQIFRYELPSPAVAGSNQTICGAYSALNAQAPAIGTGSWTLLQGQAQISTPFSPNSAIQVQPGSTSLIWEVSNGNCPPKQDTLLILSYKQPAPAFAGNDESVCTDQVILNAAAPTDGMGYWQSLSGPAQITDSVYKNSTVILPQPGTYQLRWTVINGICPPSSDEITLLRYAKPDSAIAGADREVSAPILSLKANLPVTGSGSWQLLSGDVLIENPSDPFTPIKLRDIGEHRLVWVISNGVCPPSRDELVIRTNVPQPNAFSPGSDGYNDMLIFPLTEFYDESRIKIYNRWGAMVYSDNQFKNNWKGTNMNNEPLADDTYFYTLEVSNGKTMNGFVLLKRNK